MLAAPAATLISASSRSGALPPAGRGTASSPIERWFSRAAAGRIRRTGTGRSPSQNVVVTLPASAVPMKSFAAATGMPARASASRSSRIWSCGGRLGLEPDLERRHGRVAVETEVDHAGHRRELQPRLLQGVAHDLHVGAVDLEHHLAAHPGHRLLDVVLDRLGKVVAHPRDL